MIELPGLFISTDSNGLAVFAITRGGHAIHNPRLDASMTVSVEPAHYDLTQEQVDFLVKLNETLEEATMSALNAGCFDIQKAFGIDYGDTASMYFSDDRRVQPIRQTLAEYMMRELQDLADPGE